MGRALLNLFRIIRFKALTIALGYSLLAILSPTAYAQPVKSTGPSGDITVDVLQGMAEVMPQGTTAWQPVRANMVFHTSDRIRVANNSRLSLHWSDQTVVSFGASSEWEILPPNGAGKQPGLHLLRGVISFFHRDKPGSIDVITKAALAGVKGTEFVMGVDNADAATLSVIDGQVSFGNDHDTLVLTNGQQAVAEPGAAPARTAGFIANNLLQWCFYYPAVIDVDELQLTADEQKELTDSLTAYQNGDLQGALDKYPAGRSGISGGESVYHAALLLAVGQVEKAESDLSASAAQTGQAQRLGGALRELIAAVKRQPFAGGKPEMTSELMAASYYVQSQAIKESSLRQALKLARQAAAKSPKFGYAWERVAELEFSFGDTKAALRDLDKSLALSPRNAQALALKGFALVAQDEPRQAREWFDRAIAADNALGNAWLGRGLTRIRLGDNAGGRHDLLEAAAREPQRAELRSYLGKAYASAGDNAHATKELAIAKNLDPNDPTAWLYSALLNQQNNQINDAIRDLEKSQALNDNRSVYRSGLLLDQDRAVRSADLAHIYQDAGMFDLSLREAGRAVSSDYGNYSAHLFLASSYEQLRDPNWSNLRFETPASSEFWIANLLAPTSAGWLSAIASEQPYTRLFDRNRVGVVSETTYLDRGAWMERGAQFGTYDNFSYSFEAKYISDPGQRPNNDVEHRDLNLALKYQITPHDSLSFAAEMDKITFGDVNEWYDRTLSSTSLRVDEAQEPNLFLGYHHEWSPGMHTLFFAARETGAENIQAQNVAQLYTYNLGGQNIGVTTISANEMYSIKPEIYSAELQQIWEQADHTTVLGGRYQWGYLHYKNHEDSGDILALLNFPDPSNIASQDFSNHFHRLGLYLYHDWQIIDSLTLIGGVSYDWLHLPEDVASPPFSESERSVVQFSPKAGLIWTPFKSTAIRAAYTRSLSGAISDQSLTIEPTEVAGFNQTFRDIAPESAIGSMPGAQNETYDLSLEQKFGTGTYLSVIGEILRSKNTQQDGGFTLFYDQVLLGNDTPSFPGGLVRTQHFREESVTFTADQLLGQQWSVGMRYRWSRADEDYSYPTAPTFAPVSLESVLQTVNLHFNWNHPCGLFSVFEANWYHQDNFGFNPPESGQDFWQCNAFAGCRFWHRKAEVAIGILNINDQDYQLEPLNLYNEMPRGRTFFARLLLSF